MSGREKIEKIKHAVVKTTTGMIIFGMCHADCFYQGKNLGLKMSKKSKDQGFFTNKGRFVSRAMAAKIAKKAKQLEPYKKSKRKVSHLLSEDIWYQKDRFLYTQIHGYRELRNDS